MKKVKGWFDKKQVDRKFKKAGTGMRAAPDYCPPYPCRPERSGIELS